MSERCIASIHITKLGHKLQEIRERALENIVSKLEGGYTFDNDLARSKEILQKLFEWFTFSDCTCEDVALKLIRHILQRDSGKILLKYYGTERIINELKQIRTGIEETQYELIDEIIASVNENSPKNHVVVPPFECDVPLSYRSGEAYVPDSKWYSAESTATPIEGVVRGSSLNEQQTGVEYIIEKSGRSSSTTTTSVEFNSCLPYYLLCWYPLINTDQHVLESVENSLRNPPEASALLHTCEFFSDVMLHDFPAEVFLQRPTILSELQKIIISCTSSRIKSAVLGALIKFTKLLNVRINYYSDPCTHNLKQFLSSYSSSNFSSPINASPDSNSTSCRSNLSSEIEKPETVNLLKAKQIPLPHYCLSTISNILDYLNTRPSNDKEPIYGKRWRVTTVKALSLLNVLLDLLELCLNDTIWDLSNCDVVRDVIKILREIFIKYGDTIEYIRLETTSNDFERNSRFIHIGLLNSCLKLLTVTVPPDKIEIILPRNLKSAISNALLDSSIARLYPGVHQTLLELAEKFSNRYENDTFARYRDIKTVCKSMSSAVNFLKNYKSLPIDEVILLAKESLTSLDYHKNLSLIKIFVELCANKLPVFIQDRNVKESASTIVFDLLSHYDIDVRRETYRLCTKKVITTVGPRLNTSKSSTPGSQILFLLDSRILNEIALNGISSEDPEIRKLSEDILIHVVKCKILVSEDIWNSIIETLILAFPSILCHADQEGALGRNIMNFFDPDTAQAMNLSTLEILRGNSCLLFNKDNSIRNEGVSRLCWLLASQGDNRDLLPRINNLFDKSLGMCCQIKHVYDLNRVQVAQHYYQPSSLQQVLDLLNSNNVEPVIRRSALTQISVMTEDPMLHNVFLQKNGIDTVAKIMKTALDDSDYTDYPDSIIPAVSILKNICLYNATVRQELSINLELYFLLLRGLFLFCTEERMKHEGSTLLFLLLYNQFIEGSPTDCNLSLPHIIVDKLNVPFTCQSGTSKNREERIKVAEILLKDKHCLQSLRIHWNSEWFGSFKELLNWKEIAYKTADDFDKILKLSTADLVQIQSSSLEFCIDRCLDTIQDARNHQDVVDSLVKLSGYINLYKNIKYDFIFEHDILTLPWKETFGKFLNIIPSSREDNELLQYLLEFLTALVSLHKAKGIDCWISELLRSEANPLLSLLSKDSLDDSESKIINKELLQLITNCVSFEQQYLDMYGLNHLRNTSCWIHVIELIATNLRFNDSQHFYNLAYLDSLLSCLVHLTATLGWMKSKNDTNSRTLLIQLVTDLCEMIGAFHCGKGTSAANSVMGLSITRHAVLILNHLLAEMQQADVNEWESCFIDEESGIEDNFYNLTSLWCSRDVVLRAGVFQLFAGLATAHRCAVNIVQEYRHKRQANVWEVTLDILLDHEEPSIIRENVADFLTNLTSHAVGPFTHEGPVLDRAVAPSKQGTWTVDEILKLLADRNFYNNLELIIDCLYVKNKFYIEEDTVKKLSRDQAVSKNNNFIYTFMKGTGYRKRSFSSGGSGDNSAVFFITTPGFVKSLATFLYNLSNLAPREIVGELQNHGLIRTLFKSLYIPNINITDTKDLALYCDILEMNRTVCALLNRTVVCNEACFSTILNTRDCLSVILSLLNVNIYNCAFSQLVYLRNKLWGDIFNFFGSLMSYEDGKGENSKVKNVEVLQTISSALSEGGNEIFLQSLCEAISNYNSSDLQNSALNSLTSLLRMEITTEGITRRRSSDSIQNLLDTTHTPRTTLSSKSDDKDNLENISPNPAAKKTPSNAPKVLQQLYTHPINKSTPPSKKQWQTTAATTMKETNFVIAGAELCRILLYMLEIVNIKGSPYNNVKKKSLVLNSLTNLVWVSYEAKKFAFSNDLMGFIVRQIREVHVKLSLESVESLRRVSDKKRITSILQEIHTLVGLLTNFMAGDVGVKEAASSSGLADFIHKLWVWILTQKNLLVDVLKMLCTYTGDSPTASQSLTLTSSVAGTGPRKLPSNVSLLHSIISLISKEMEQISRTRDLSTLELSFHLLENCCASTECRIILSKSPLLQSLTRLHPAITKKQKPWETVELIWLEFLQAFSSYPEGQFCIAKVSDALDLITLLTNSSRLANRQAALSILRNISFYSSNRPRLLSSSDFLNVLGGKLVCGNLDEKITVTTIIWALAANNQKAKLMLKCAGLETKLQEALKALHLSVEYEVDPEVLDRMYYVLNMLKDGEK